MTRMAAGWFVVTRAVIGESGSTWRMHLIAAEVISVAKPAPQWAGRRRYLMSNLTALENVELSAEIAKNPFSAKEMLRSLRQSVHSSDDIQHGTFS